MKNLTSFVNWCSKNSEQVKTRLKLCKNYVRTLTAILLLTLGVGNAWGNILIEGFETKTAAQTYKVTVNISTAESDCGIGWTIYYGNVSTTDKIDGSNSVALKLYYGEANYGYLKTTTAITNLEKISFAGKASTTNSSHIYINIEYSIDNGDSWSFMKIGSASGDPYLGQSLTSSADDYTAYVPSGVTGDFLIRFSINSSSTKPTSGSTQLTIDNVTFFSAGSNQFELVDDVSKLTSGDEIIILNSDNSKALSTNQKTYNRDISTDFSTLDDIVTLTDNTVQILKLRSNSTNWTLHTGEGYLYADGTSANNYLRTKCANDYTTCVWSISISDKIATITAQGTNDNRLLRYYSSLFSCYNTSNTSNVKIYKRLTDYDKFVDVMHGTIVAKRYGDYEMPNIDDAVKGSTYEEEKHYIFIGWVEKDDWDEHGVPTGSIIAPGTEMTAANKTYYAVWGKE